jgi:hypothetical protein
VIVMSRKINTIDGKLFLNEISFDACIKTTVKKHSATASMIYLPASWEGKIIYVIQEKKVA